MMSAGTPGSATSAAAAQQQDWRAKASTPNKRFKLTPEQQKQQQKLQVRALSLPPLAYASFHDFRPI